MFKKISKLLAALAIVILLSITGWIYLLEGYFLSSKTLEVVSQNSRISKDYLAEHLDYKYLSCDRRSLLNCIDGDIHYSSKFGAYNGSYTVFFEKEGGILVSRSKINNTDSLISSDVVQNLIEKCNSGRVYKSSEQYLFIDGESGKFILVYKGYHTDSKERFYATQIDLANGRFIMRNDGEVCGRFSGALHAP